MIDLQPAFIKPHNEHIVSRIAELINAVSYDAYVEAVFHAEKGSLWDVQQGFYAPKDQTMHTVNEVRNLLEPFNPLKVVKNVRSVFYGNKDVVAYLRDKAIEEVHLVGTETHDCVLATAYDAFNYGFLACAIEECCESATVGRNEVGLQILRWQNMTNNSWIAA